MATFFAELFLGEMSFVSFEEFYVHITPCNIVAILFVFIISRSLAKIRFLDATALLVAMQ
jgi:hypothetical protein